MLFVASPIAAPAQIGITVSFGPPAIPYYVQPEDPTPNWIWSPGYWAYDFNGDGYYWVPGTWVPAPSPGLYWTPGYWAWDGNNYFWTPGYWANQVGYYGGVNYGYGYYGRGYAGGRWIGRQFAYNTAVSRVDRTHIRNVYVNRAVVVNTWNRTSYNGGRGGVTARPNASELAVQRSHRVSATPVQVRHQQAASQNRAAFSHVNGGRPAVAAVARPLTTNRGPQAHGPQNRAAAPIHHSSAAAPHAVPQAMHNAAPQRVAPQAHVAPAVHHAAPAYHPAAATHAAPAYHAAPAVRAAPAYHAAPAMHAAPAYHPAPQMHAAPAYHPAPAPAMHAAPQMHAAPAMRPAPAMHAAPAAPHAAPAPGGNDREHHDGH
jgi:hypothetical protein